MTLKIQEYRAIYLIELESRSDIGLIATRSKRSGIVGFSLDDPKFTCVSINYNSDGKGGWDVADPDTPIISLEAHYGPDTIEAKALTELSQLEVEAQ
tara:strand:- start:870 stop:1160 length:291 start_codon:yes stop_codon:yes gene_type:complete